MRIALPAFFCLLLFLTAAHADQPSAAFRHATAASDVADTVFEKALRAKSRAPGSVSDKEISRLRLTAELCRAKLNAAKAQEEVERIEAELGSLLQKQP